MLRTSGTFVEQEYKGVSFQAFVPNSLPPKPPLDFDIDLVRSVEQANRALGRLDATAQLLPDSPHVLSNLLYQYVRKEAVLSSQIEGTQSSLSDLLLFEIDEVTQVPLDDVEEVSSYVEALTFGLNSLDDGAPLSLSLLKNIHALLLSHGRGADQSPGEFRNDQNWIGGLTPALATFVPPPALSLPDCLDALEQFMQVDSVLTSSVIKAALAHAQFETIHPFRDGNGRLGRMLIALILHRERVLDRPILYLSLFFKQHRMEYYDRLQRVRTHGDWEGWLKFFLEGTTEAAVSAVATTKSLVHLFDRDRHQILNQAKRTKTALRVHDYFSQYLVASIPMICKSLDYSHVTIGKTLKILEDLKLVREVTGQSRNRIYVYSQYLDILTKE